MGRGRSGRTSSSASAPAVPSWREAFHDGRDYQQSGDVNHKSRTVSSHLQQEWDEFSRDYQTGVTNEDIRNLRKEWDFIRNEGYGYVRSGNSFKINQLLYDPANANKTDEEIFTRKDRRGVLRDLNTVRTMDKLINSHATKNDAIYTRFADPGAIQAMYGLSDKQMAALLGVRGTGASRLNALNRALANKTGYSRSYTSTSANRSMNAFGDLSQKQSTKLVFERKLYVPGGTKAYAPQMNAQESEVIFARHANTRLMKITVSNDGHIVLHEMFTGYKKH